LPTSADRAAARSDRAIPNQQINAERHDDANFHRP
jgi:hypothetical protein